MDSNSSYDLLWPKLEIDSENDSPRKETRINWTSDNTIKLIKLLEKDCKELWDVKNPLNKDRCARQAKLDYLADQFGTTAEEISRKIHNLRTQMNNELRKIKRRHAAVGGGEASGVGGSGWEYFEALSFLMRAPTAGDSPTFPSDPLDSVEGVNLEVFYPSVPFVLSPTRVDCLLSLYQNCLVSWQSSKLMRRRNSGRQLRGLSSHPL